MAWANKILIPYTIYGGVSTGDNGGVNTLSGFTNALTEFSFYADTSNNVYDYISSDKFLWDLGDGTVVKHVSASHVYKYPGIYNVTLVAYDSGGNEYLSTEVKQISVNDFFPDRLTLDTDDIASVRNIPVGVTNSKLNPINVIRNSSLQSYAQLSGTGFSLNLYASGSESLPRDNATLGKWSHLDQTWSFYTNTTADNGTVLFNPVKSVKTTNEEIYYEAGSKFGQPFYRRVPLSAVGTAGNSTAVLVGTSGTCEFLYADDLPKHTSNPIFVFASLDTSQMVSFRQILDNDHTSTATGDLLLPSLFEKFSLVIPVRTRYRHAIKLTFSSSGISSMIIDKTKWQSTEIPFFVDLVDEDNNFTENYPGLSGYQVNTGDTSVSDVNVVNLSVVSGNNDDPTLATTTSILSSHFYRENDSQLPNKIKGKFRGYVIPYQAGDNVALSGTVVVNDTPHFPKDVYLGCIGNTDAKEVRIAHFKDRYSYNDTSGGIDISSNIEFVSIPIDHAPDEPVAYTPFSVATVYNNNDYDDSRVSHMCGGLWYDALSSINTYSQQTSSVSLSSMWDGFTNENPRYSDTILVDHTYGEGTDPTSLAYDEDRNLWMALSAGMGIFQIAFNRDPVAGPRLGTLHRAINHIDANGAPENYVKLGRNIIEPTIVETGIKDSVWIACTNPLSSFISKWTYDGTETVPEAATQSFKYELQQGIVATDINATNQDQLWVGAKSMMPELTDLRIKQQTVSALSATHDTVKYKFSTGIVDFSDNAIALSANYVLHLSGYSNDFFNGKFLIKGIDGDVITVKPFLGKVNNLPSQTLSEANIDASVYVDKVYKITTASTVIELSGFFDPHYIITDKYQGLWVAHDINTLTYVNTAGEIGTSIKVFDNTFVSTYVSGGSVYNYTASGDTPHIGGLSFDTYDNLLVINAYESKLYKIPTQTPTLSTSYTISTSTLPIANRPTRIFGNHRAFGDWTSYRWMNKFKNTTGLRTVTGAVTVNIYPSGGKYKIAKINENFDPIETVKTYRTQPILVDNGKVLFDDFYGSIIGSISSEPTALGRVIYEKIANFTDNVADIETCNIPALYSMCNQYNINPKQFDLSYPGALSRIMNLASISHSKLWGQRSRFDRDFETYGSNSGLYGKNIGDKITTSTGIVTAGKMIIAQQIFNKEYTLINPMYVSAGSVNEPGYDATVGKLSSYPLSSYNKGWGWGLGSGTTKDNLNNYYTFYNHAEYYNNILLEGLIDWNNSYTNISESVSGVDDWVGKGGIIDTAIDYELRKGLGLFNTTLSAHVQGVQ